MTIWRLQTVLLTVFLNEAIAEEKLVELWPENKMKRIKGNSLKIYICRHFEI